MKMDCFGRPFNMEELMKLGIRRIISLTLLVVAILAAAQIVAGVSAPSGSPYLSALSDMAAQSALAAPGCNNKTCEKDPRKGPTCFSATGSNCKVAGGCTSTPC
jgi:hypothetical protein